MVFDCQQCGECCSHLGLVHSITEDRGNYEFVVFNRYTNESNVVTVDAEKHALFDDKSIFTSLPEACPFFRHQPGSEKAFCTVHLTRPDICRDYRLLADADCQPLGPAGGPDHVLAIPLLGGSDGASDFCRVHRPGKGAGRRPVGRVGDPGVYEKWICGEEVRGCFPLFWTGTSSCFFRNSRMICTGFCEKCRSVESAVKTRSETGINHRMLFMETFLVDEEYGSGIWSVLCSKNIYWYME